MSGPPVDTSAAAAASALQRSKRKVATMKSCPMSAAPAANPNSWLYLLERFDVKADGKILYSKALTGRQAEPGELARLVAALR